MGMQLVHLLLADLLWVALVVLCWHPDIESWLHRAKRPVVVAHSYNSRIYVPRRHSKRNSPTQYRKPLGHYLRMAGTASVFLARSLGPPGQLTKGNLATLDVFPRNWFEERPA
jgi:hypothetical protein